MTQVSRRFLKKEIENQITTIFQEAYIMCNSQDETAEFLHDLLTPTEKIMLSKRLAIAYLLLKGNSYLAIQNILKVSNSTVRNVSLVLKIRGKGMRRIIDKLTRKQKWQKLFRELADSTAEILTSSKKIHKRLSHRSNSSPL